MPDAALLDRHFPRYEAHAPRWPVWCCTPGEGRCLHRFFDTSPISPDGRRLAVFRLPFEDRLNAPGETGQVVVIDLETGAERVVARTAGFEAQLGANLNWAGDGVLVFNDVQTATWTPQLVRLDLETGRRQAWAGGVYHVSPDGRWAAAPSTAKMRRTQQGYGVVLPDEHVGRNIGAVDDDGLFITDLHTGERRLVLSLARAVKAIPDLRALPADALAAWEIYGFHCKWSPSGDRLIFTIRRYRHEDHDRFDAFAWGHDHVRFDVLTVRPDGSDVHDAVPAERWRRGGHHINFFPDGAALSANIRLADDQPLSLIRVDLDGGNFGRLTQRTIGSGHPTVHPDGRHILTDTYAHESLSFGDGSVPLRWIDRQADAEQTLARIHARVEPQPTGVLRVDLHPAWDRTWRWVTFNGVADNTRRVYLMQMP